MNDKWLRIALIATPCALFLYDFLHSDSSNLQANIVYILTVILVCEGSRFIIYRSRKWSKPPRKKIKRVLMLIPGIVFVAIIFIASKALRNYIAYGDSGMDSSDGFVLTIENDQVKVGLIGTSIVNAIFTFLLLLGIFDLAYYFARLKHAERERDRFEKEKLQAELQQLKGIVNPHFLFNNLNSLSSLISENPSQAEAFLDELTKVFRYLLRNNETEVTTLAQELEFMNSYYHLLQTRYGRAISMKVDIDETCVPYLLPPMTLQLLVENAVKHNRVQKEDPLQIELFNDGTRLIIRNNILIRQQLIESTGIGLRSIQSRYKLLNHAAPTITKDEQFFSVTIPLITPNAYSAYVPGNFVSHDTVA